MKYSCPECHYETNIKCNFDKHVSTQKHREKVTKTPIVPQVRIIRADTKPESKQDDQKRGEEKIICEFCHSTFASAPNLKRHKKTCDERSSLIEASNKREADLKKDHDREIAEIKMASERKLEKEIDELRRTYDARINDLIREYESRLSSTHKENSDKAFQIVNKMSTLSCLSHVFRHGPRFQRFEKFPLFQNVADYDKETEIIIYDYKKKQISKTVGDMIVKEYKTEKPQDQTFWNSDITRNSYLIREGESDESSEWITDKSGIKISTCAMGPVLIAIKDRVKNYVSCLSGKIDGNNYGEHLQKMKLGNQLVDDIDNGTIAKEIHRYIGSHFYYDKNKYLKRLPEPEILEICGTCEVVPEN